MSSSAAAANNWNWVMLERFVFRRDDDESFPDESEAPIRASGTTSSGAPFRVAFKLAEPPAISRLYAQLPGFPGHRKQTPPLAILATHRHLALFRVGIIQDTTGALVQDFFVYNASDDDPSSSLKRLSPCTLPDMDDDTLLSRFHRRRRPPPHHGNVEYRRVMTVASMGLFSRGEREFAVAELKFSYPRRRRTLPCPSDKVYADIFWLRSSLSAPEPAAGAIVNGQWNSARVPVFGSDDNSRRHLTWQDFCWQTDTVVPVHNSLCWINNYSGILFCDLFQEPTPTLSFVPFPPEEFPSTDARVIASCWFYCSASAIDAGRALKFVRVIRHDGKRYGPLKADASGFTITCRTLLLETMAWTKDYTVTSDELWSVNPPERLPRDVLMFPQVNIDRPHVLHFLIVEFEYVMKKMWVVTIDMNTRIAESCFQYINGREDIGTEDADLTKRKSSSPDSFLASELFKFLHISRY